MTAGGPAVVSAGWAGWPWLRVTAVTEDRSRRPGAPADYLTVLPAVMAAAAGGRSFVTGWVCRGGGAPLELVTNAGPLPGGARTGGGPVEMLFPWGALGEPAPPGLAESLGGLRWTLCPGRQAVPLEGSPAGGNGARPAGADTGRSQFEAALITLLGRPFGWLVVAEPGGETDSEAAALRSRLTMLRRLEEERARFDAGRIERRLAELDAFRDAGLWSVRVLAGAATEDELAVIAPLLASAIDLREHPYRLGSAGTGECLESALRASVTDPSGEAQAPFTATAGVLTALAGLPRREVPGVRVLEPRYFDLTSETGPGGSVVLGMILDDRDRPVGECRVPLRTLNRHALVAGATGAGKSQTVRHLLEQLTAEKIGWLVIEPAKAEYSGLAGRIAGRGELTVVNPADPAAVPLSVNPLQPEPGYPVQAHIDMLRALFLAAFEAYEPFPQIISQALQRVYEGCGWDPVTGGGRPGATAPPAVPTLAGLRQAALEVIADVGYGAELAADVRGFTDVRLASLRTGSAGRFFEGGHPADIGGLLRSNVVLEIEGLANDEDKAFLIGTLIIRIVEHLRLASRDRAAAERLRHVIVIEEAHRLLRAQRSGPGAHAVELFAGLLAEIRAYGEGIVVAEQIPAKIVPDVVKNTALKIVHRLPALDDRQLVGAAMNLGDDQSRQVVSLPPGVAVVFADGMDRPLRVRVPFGGDREQAAGSARGLPPLAGRRSAACGPACTGGRPCALAEIRAAELAAAAPEQAWLRVWAEVLILGYLTGNALPAVPAALRKWWAGVPGRRRECALAAVIQAALQGRDQALRSYFDTGMLAAAAAERARALLDGPDAATSPGPAWVIPPLRWLHEAERSCPLDGPARGAVDPAPPVEFALPGVDGSAAATIGDRVGALRRHPLSTELAANRMTAWTALLGADEQRAFMQDVTSLAVGLPAAEQLRAVAAELGAGWLEAVLSWPRRFIASTGGLTVATTRPS
jgi:hypothetical protein